MRGICNHALYLWYFKIKYVRMEFVTFQRVYKNVTGCDLTNTVNNLDTLEERFEFVLHFF